MKPIEVAFVRYKEEAEGTVSWHCDELFVSNALVGGGIMARFLDGLIVHFRSRGVQRITVTISDNRSPFLPNRAARWALVETINFYKSRGFIYENVTGPKQKEAKIPKQEQAILSLSLNAEPIARTSYESKR